MKNILTLSVEKPCSEKWEHFTSTSDGGFCRTCQKDVIDFTQLSDEQVLDFFKNQPVKSCGRFAPHQLRAYPTKATADRYSSWQALRSGFMGLLLLMTSKQAFAHTMDQKPFTHYVQIEENTPKSIDTNPLKIIQGTVRDEYKEPLPGVNIYLKGTSIGTTTDAAGNFTFPKELKAGDVLVFAFIGFETKQYTLTKDTTSGIDIVLVTLYADILGEVAVNIPYSEKPTGMSKWWEQLKALF